MVINLFLFCKDVVFIEYILGFLNFYGSLSLGDDFRDGKFRLFVFYESLRVLYEDRVVDFFWCIFLVIYFYLE